MLAYRVNYWPWQELSPAARDLIRFNTPRYIPKKDVLDMCNEEMTKLRVHNRWYPIKWAWNNIPTEFEWNKKSDSYLIRVELRASPMIDGYFQALLSFELLSERDFTLGNHH